MRIEITDGCRIVDTRRLILRHGVGQVAINAAGAIVRSVHAGAGNRFVTIHQVFALAEAIQENSHRADVQRVSTEPQAVIENARDLVKHDADVLRTQRHLYADQLLDRHYVRVLISHHGHVIETVHVGNGLDKRLVFRELLGGAV